uniref:Bromo domain-containing protein n=1 Tax=Caenorhabditis japonica TaxID=281687 RepID=A0A8R1DI64_CAEJA
MSDSNAVGEQRPWASPRQNPIKGVVQPRVLPPFGKPTRHTNKLDYIMNTVLKEASKHKHVWPFQKPVDAVGLCIPLYHEKIARPMDLKTIENRLKSTYYTCAQECIDDIETVFNNCYIFNGKEDDVTIMAQNVHEVIKKSLETAPREEHDMEVYWGKNKKKGKSASVTSDKKKDVRGPSEPPSECGSEASGVGKADKKISGKKAGKRKADSDEEEKPESLRVKRDVATHKKENTILPALKPCLKLMNEFYSKKYHVSLNSY